MFELKLRKVGNSVGIILPKAVLAHLSAEEGDTLTFTDVPDGRFRVTASTEGRPQFARQMKAVKKVVRRYRNTLHELAK